MTRTMTRTKILTMSRTMIRLSIVLLTLAAGSARAGELTITFIGNEGMHITDGAQTLLVDFPYKSGAFGYMEYEMVDVPESPDALHLITHFHADHWVKGLFEELAAESELHIIAPPGILASLDHSGEIDIISGAERWYKQIHVLAVTTAHRLSPEHFSYLVTWHGLRLYFVGDTENPSEILRRKDIDVMFVTPWLVRTMARQGLSLAAKQLILYHHKTGEKVPEFGNLLRLDQGESFVVDYGDYVRPSSYEGKQIGP